MKLIIVDSDYDFISQLPEGSYAGVVVPPCHNNPLSYRYDQEDLTYGPGGTETGSLFEDLYEQGYRYFSYQYESAIHEILSQEDNH